MIDGQGYDPHYLDGCYFFKCAKGVCPFHSDCFRAEGIHQKETRDFIDSINRRLLEGDNLDSLPATEDVKLRHAIAMHGFRYDPKESIFSRDIQKVPNGRGIYLAFGDLTNSNPDVKTVGIRANLFT